MKFEVTFDDWQCHVIKQETVETEAATARCVIKMIEQRGFLTGGDRIRIKQIHKKDAVIKSVVLWDEAS
jgi:hypothetical protein